MRMYLAGSGGLVWKGRDFYDFHRLDSYLAIDKQNEDPHRYRSFILDSGIFSYLTSRDPTKVDWEKYATEYAQYVKKAGIRNYVEIDIDRVLGLGEVERLRQYIEKKVGWKCMPVWHMGRGYDKWLEICRDYDYVCFGAFLTDNLAPSKFGQITHFLKDAKKQDCKVHGLGFTSGVWMPRLPFHSVDSSSWTAGIRYGFVFEFRQGVMKQHIRPASHIISDPKALHLHNFYEWVKFAEYAETNF